MSQHYGLPLSCFDGDKAVTTQSFTELNVKQGLQFEASGYTPDAVTEDLLLQTGSNYVILKAIDLQIDGDGIQYQFWKNATGTSAQSYTGYSLKTDGENPEMTIDLSADADITGATEASPLITIIGSASPGVSAAPTSKLQGLERILEPNTTYLLRRESLTDAQAQKSAFYLTWFEGSLSVDNLIDPLTGRL